MRRGSSVVAGLGVLASVGIMAAALTGCGSSGPSSSTGLSSAAQVTSGQEEPTTSTPSTETTPATTATATTLPEVGTYTLAAKNTKFVSQVRLGSLQYGQAEAPPSEVLSACPTDEETSDSIGNEAFAQGELVMSYAEGSVPLQMVIDGKGALAGAGTSDTVVHSSQDWTCGGEGLQYTFQPGQTMTVPFWILNRNALTNSRPRLSQSELNGVTFNLVPTGTWESEDHTVVTLSGPQAAACNDTDDGTGRYKLLPYAQLPSTTNGTTCHKATDTFTLEGSPSE
jgi:hypothetical protein